MKNWQRDLLGVWTAARLSGCSPSAPARWHGAGGPPRPPVRRSQVAVFYAASQVPAPYTEVAHCEVSPASASGKRPPRLTQLKSLVKGMIRDTARRGGTG